MKNRVSLYEERQVMEYLYELYTVLGNGMDEKTFIDEGWVVYLEKRRKYRGDISDVKYWEYIQKNIEEHIGELKKENNRKRHMESELSLNQVFGDNKEEIGSIIAGKTGDFVNGVVLWDYVNSLGAQKYNILHLMNRREEDNDIIQILGLNEDNYYRIKSELKMDFQKYLEE